jgi:predicted DNA binding CopG/RHH family protein
MKAKPMPPLRSDAEADQFVAKADLSQYDLSGFTPMRFEITPEETALTMRGPGEMPR